MKQQRQHFEEDGFYISNAEHWELLENRPIYIYKTKKTSMASILIPVDIVRHLGLKHKDKITIAIYHKKEE